MRNAFQTSYVPIAIPYQFAQSGFIGENGRPRTFGVSVGVTFWQAMLFLLLGVIALFVLVAIFVRGHS